ncbi:hypothetical protein PVAND_015026 [Polypedilum vanderplanki]|uniref:NACHT domain-containing protein n=1 Tax=Polypedilum vanderplanki TaxID=319348 RepID=A0A9J6BBT6_POLVA|nr:hypothetical protein PVAND_015026 [Polypedilum vanderplanki]
MQEIYELHSGTDNFEIKFIISTTFDELTRKNKVKKFKMFNQKSSKTPTIKIARLIIKKSESKKLTEADYNEIQRMLPSTNVNIQIKNLKNDTLLHLAVRMKDEKLFEMLLNENGDVMINNKDGESVLDLAKKLKCEEIVELVEAKLNQINAGIVHIKDDESHCIEIKSQMLLDRKKIKYLKVIKVKDFKELFAINENFCDIFPNLFAIKIDCSDDCDENVLLNQISQKFNDNRPMLINFIKTSSYFFRQVNSNFFENENLPEFHTVYSLIHNQGQTFDIRKSVIEKNDILAMRFLKIFKVANEHKLIMDSINFGTFEMFLASVNFPFNGNQENFIPEIADLMTKVFDADQSILKFSILHEKVEIFDFLINNFKNLFSLLPFDHKKSIINLTVDKNLNEFLLRLLKIDFPFPDSEIKNLSDDIRSLIEEREIFHSSDINAIKTVIKIIKNQKDSFIRVGFGSNNHSALYNAIKNNNYKVYGYLLSIGFICKNINEENEISKIINELPDEKQNKIKQYIGLKNIENAKLDRRRFLIKLATKFAIYGFYENDLMYDEKFNLILEYLIELSKIPEINSLLEFCEQIESLRVGVDFENDGLLKFEPSSDDSWGVSYCDTKLVFVASTKKTKIIETIVHELLHIALEYYYENDSKPYFQFDVENERKFKKIVADIQNNLKENSDDECLRAYEILVAYKNDEEKLKELKLKYEDLFEFSKNFITNALKIDEVKIRFKIRNLNKYIGLLQDIEASPLKLSKHKKRIEKIKKILKSENNFLIVSNIPILTLIELKKYLEVSQYLLFDAWNIFVQPASLENEKVYSDFQDNLFKLENISFNLIVDFSQNTNIRAIQNNSKSIFITSTENHVKVQRILEENNVFYYEDILNYSFNDLTFLSQENFLRSQVKFQEKFASLSKLIDEKFMQEDAANELFINLCNQKLISINSTNFFPDDYFVERSFVLSPGEVLLLKIPPSRINQFQKIQPVYDPYSKILKHINVQITQEFEYDMNRFLLLIENEKIILISDIGGSGKSRILKKIFNIFVKSSDKWVIFISLPEYLKKLKTFTENLTFKNFFEQVLSKKFKNFEKEIFYQYYKKGNVKIFMDGFDEISPKCKEKGLEIIKSIINTKKQNQLWISTRKHLEIDLQKILGTKMVFYLKPLDQEGQKEFLIKYWKFKKIDKFDLEKNANEIVTKFSGLQSQRRNFIGIMQQLKILADIYKDNDEISVDSIENLTMYQIYEHSVEDYIKKWQSSELGKEEDRKTHFGLKKTANFQTVHQYYALLKHLDETRVKKLFENEGKIWDLETVARGAIITYFKSTETTIFIHATYVDYFTANFLLQALDNDIEFENLAQFFLDTLCDWQKATIQMFINDKLEEINISDEKIKQFVEILEKSSKYDWLASSVVNSYHKNFDFFIKIIENLSNNQKIQNISPHLVLCLGKNSLHVDEKMFDKIFNLFTNFDNQTFIEGIKTGSANGFTIAHYFFKNNFNVRMMKKLMSEIIQRSDGNENDVQEIILGTKVPKTFEAFLPINSIIMHAKENDLEKLIYFWELHENFVDADIKKFIYENILINISMASNEKIFDYFYEKIKKLPDLKFAEMIKESLIFFAENIRKPIHETLWKYLKIEESEGNLKIKELLSNFYQNENYLQRLVYFNISDEVLELTITEIMKNVENPLEILMSKNKRKMNLLQLSLFELRPITFLEVLFKLLFEYCGREKFKQLLLDDSAGESLIVTASIKSSFDVFRLIEDFMEKCKITDDEFKICIADGRDGKNYKNFLILPTKNNISLDVHKYFWILAEKFYKDDLKRFVTEKVDKKLKLLAIAVKFNTIEIIDFIWSKIKEILPEKSSQRKYLKSAAGKTTNLYEIAVNENKFNSVIWVQNVCEEYGI